LGGSSSVEEFFNKPEVKEILHAPASTYWQGCIPGAGRRRLNRREKVEQNRGVMRRLIASLLENDRPESTVPYIAELLDGGVRVMAYNGDRDLSCNAAGTEKLLNDMQWSGADDWYATKRGLWTVNNEPAGYGKSLKGLDFVVVYNSGHLVPVSRNYKKRDDTNEDLHISQQIRLLLLFAV
jgi:carboxypeptidase C (cathepsin A)